MDIHQELNLILHQIRDILIASLIVILLPNKIFNKIEKIIKLKYRIK